MLITLLAGVSAVSAYEETRELILPAENIDKLSVDCGAGFLKIRGDESVQAITVSAEIVMKKADDDEAEEYLKDNLELTLERERYGKRGI